MFIPEFYRCPFSTLLIVAEAFLCKRYWWNCSSGLGWKLDSSQVANILTLWELDFIGGLVQTVVAPLG